jgi:hypothetical protein
MIASTLIEVPQWENATLIEVIWLVSGLFALTLTLLRLPVLLRDYRYAQERGDGDLCVISRSYLRREIVRIAQAGAVIAIGVYAVLSPPLVPGPARISLVGLWLTGTLISISLLIGLQSFLDWRDREKVNKIIGGAP